MIALLGIEKLKSVLKNHPPW